MLTYKGYNGQFSFDAEAGIFFGRVIDISDVVTFKADTADEVIEAFEDSVDDYLEFCALARKKQEAIDDIVRRSLGNAFWILPGLK